MRCIRTVKALRLREGSELTSIALYTDVDRDAPFVRHADQAVRLADRATPVQSYLDIDLLLKTLRDVDADAVWPGWGFVSESPAFVDRLDAAGIRFLGPSAETMRALGDKIAAKRLAQEAEVPVAPWSGGELATEAHALEAATRVGYPVMLKASAGGGGRGIRPVDGPDQLAEAYRSAQAEAAAAFGDDRLFLERRISHGRHIEVQIAGDTFGHLIALGCRDCSVQRRHQKVLEEAPPPHLSGRMKDALCDAALRAARAVGYHGLGTVEFLVFDDEFNFLEVNPRLQVEHGITESITGLDLVELQIRIARGESIADVRVAERGVAIEARLCAEDPAAGFLPSPGRVGRFDAALGPGVRVDSGVVEGSEIPAAFDSLIAKVIASGPTREDARARLAGVLADLDLVIEGGASNKGYLLGLLGAQPFRDGVVDTGWLDREEAASLDAPGAAEDAPYALVAAAILAYQQSRDVARRRFYTDSTHIVRSRIPSSVGQQVDLTHEGTAYRLHVYGIGSWRYRLQLDGDSAVATLAVRDGHTARLEVGGRSRRLVYDWGETSLRIEIDGRPFRFSTQSAGQVRADTPALLVTLEVEVGDHVEAGQTLGVLEAMKMEIAFRAPTSGVVREVCVKPGQQVGAGDLLLAIDVAEGEAGASTSIPVCLPRTKELAPEQTVREEIGRVLLGYDVDDERGDELVRSVDSSPIPDRTTQEGREQLDDVQRAIVLFADIEQLFLRSPQASPTGEVGPSNNSRLRTFVRRLHAGGAGLDTSFLDKMRTALLHYGVADFSQTDPLERAVLRLLASQETAALRHRLALSLIRRLQALGAESRTLRREERLADALSAIGAMRGLVSDALADVALEARHSLFDKPRLERRLARVGPRRSKPEKPDLGIDRLEKFDLEEIPADEGLRCFFGRSRDVPGDERVFVFGEIPGETAAQGRLTSAHLAAFEIAFQRATTAMRTILAERDPQRRLQWNRITLFVEPAIVVGPDVARELSSRLAPATRRLGLEKVVLRLNLIDPDAPDRPAREQEVVVTDVTGNRMRIFVRDPDRSPVEPATEYERKVADARRRRLVYPYEIVNMLGGAFEEFDIADGRPVSVAGRPYGQNESGIVFGLIRSDTEDIPEGMERVLVLSDPTRGMGSLAAPECDRVVAAIDLAEERGLPVEWIPVSSGARIAMDSGTENLDATARVARRVVEFTQNRGIIHVIVYGVNVGAQSYWDALATMLPHTRGALIMTPTGSMVLTGRDALEASGAVAAEDEIAIGGFERIAGPNGESQYFANDLASACGLLGQHYRYTYVVPGEKHPRRRATSDPFDRDVSSFPYEANGDKSFATVGEIFASESNPGRKKPFAMRPVMAALVDQDGGSLERWHAWQGAETSIVWDAQLGGIPISLIGIESRSLARQGYRSFDGPADWSGGTLYPLSSRKIARALNAASGNRPAVILANLSGFDGSPESLRRLQLEHGAEIARAVVNFDGPLLFLVVSRYHGGAYVVFSQALNPGLQAIALDGSYASVIGGGPAAKVVFGREVKRRAAESPRVQQLRAEWLATQSVASRAAMEEALAEAELVAQSEVAAEFDAIHTVERARDVGSLKQILPAAEMRPRLIRALEEALGSSSSAARRGASG